MDEKSISIIPFLCKKETWRLRLGKFMVRASIKGYAIILTGDKLLPADNKEKIQWSDGHTEAS